MTKLEQIQNQILEKMADSLSDEQLQKLENVLAIEFHGVEVQEECTQLVTSELRWQKILNTFLASKRIENCSLGTLDRYKECVTKLVTTLNKRLQDITTNDIRYYLAMYQEQRKISISYMDTIRRYLSSFFAWISAPEENQGAAENQETFYTGRARAFTLLCTVSEGCRNHGIPVQHSGQNRRSGATRQERHRLEQE